VSAATDRTITYQNLPEADYAAALVGAGLPEPVAQVLAGCDTSASQGALFSTSTDLVELIGRPSTPLATAVADGLAALAPSA
jgi:NAD(P)H dehydrogenase (quinone)